MPVDCTEFLTDREVLIAILTELETSNSGGAGTPMVFQENILFVRNNAGTLETSNDEVTWTINSGPHIPASINSFYIMNLGQDGDGAVFGDIALDLDGTTHSLNAQEATWEETTQDDINTLVGNISVTPAIGHIVRVGYRIKL